MRRGGSLAAAAELGVRDSFHEDPATLSGDERYGAFPGFTRLAAASKFTVPVAGAFPLDPWRTPRRSAKARRVRGNLLLLPAVG